MKLFMDSDSVGLRTMLSQAGKSIAYSSRTFNSEVKNYATIDRKFLEVIWVL